MTGAFLELVAKGSQDIYLTGNPSVTFFRSVYKKHTNFSIENVEQTIEGTKDFGQNLTCTLSRKGDLISSVILEVDLPKLTGILGSDLKWVDSIGHYLIKEIELDIGGQIIEKHYGEWMEIWNELTLHSEHNNGYKNMVGKGVAITTQKTLIIPLQFWFCRNIGLALPLISLQYHQVKINIVLNDFNKLWHKELIKYNVTRTTGGAVTINVADSDTDDFSDINLASERYEGMNIIWEDGEENIISSTGTITDTLNVSGTTTAKTGNIFIVKDIPDKTYELEDIRLYCDYIYLDTAERKHFAQKQHSYLIEQIQFNGVDDYSKGTNSVKVGLDFNHPCKELFWVSQLSLCETLNQHNNFSDNVSAGSVTEDNPLIDAVLQLNGTERFKVRKADYFRLLVPYQRHTRTPDKFVYVYSFSLNPEQTQPSGTCNFSRIDNSELLLNMKSTLEKSKVRIYATNYNILRIVNGMGGVAYSN